MVPVETGVTRAHSLKSHTKYDCLVATDKVMMVAVDDEMIWFSRKLFLPFDDTSVYLEIPVYGSGRPNSIDINTMAKYGSLKFDHGLIKPLRNAVDLYNATAPVKITIEVNGRENLTLYKEEVK